MTPLENYQKQVDAGKIVSNPEQLKIMQLFDDIYRKLNKQTKKLNSTSGRLISSLTRKKNIKGLYLWGNVGVGKTFLMDLFYDTLNVKKMRIHFHKFMERIHTELNQLQGHENPLSLIAKKLAKETKVLCFDEFFVSDIADAMLLGGLFEALFSEGICLISSSNVAPDDLYKDGIQREQFLPAIEQIKANTESIHVFTTTDYRLRHLQEAGVYFTPDDSKADQSLQKIFRHFAANVTPSSEPIIVFGRPIKIINQAGKAIWFEFQDLCSVPRSQKDYLELAKEYRTILISHLPVIKADQDSLITNFIHLIDVLYDAHIRVVISAEKPIEEIYVKGRLLFEFRRTQSRIIEMQSEDYFFPGGTTKWLTQL